MNCHHHILLASIFFLIAAILLAFLYLDRHESYYSDRESWIREQERRRLKQMKKELKRKR